ncbi:hypothetical protein HMPREF0043_02096 [Actinobaculum sp. oral taxon 183 str. F0552]|nr:hypothetical protein HMPREF0043_02096 [Actinobaculum sp. oral taxon 183 str. F0552]
MPRVRGWIHGGGSSPRRRSVRSQELCRRSGVWKAQPRAPLSSKGNEATVGSQYVKES